MALLHILEYPHPGLREKAKPIEKIDNQITQLASNMLETMYDAPGIGLAATQVNIAKQLIVIDISDTKDQPMVIINPEITSAEGHQTYEEGCLSFPGIYAKVERANNIVLSYMNLEGEKQTIEADGLLAICIQHEMDHLAGKVFVDYLSPLKRNRIRKSLEKQQRQATKNQ